MFKPAALSSLIRIFYKKKIGFEPVVSSQIWNQCWWSRSWLSILGSVADPGWLFRIQGLKDPGSETNFCNQKIVSKLSEIWSGIFILRPDFFPIPDLDPESRGQKIIGPQIQIRYTGFRVGSWSNHPDPLHCLNQWTKFNRIWWIRLHSYALPTLKKIRNQLI